MENIFELLLDHYATNSYSISFPELVFLAVRKVFKYSKYFDIQNSLWLYCIHNLLALMEISFYTYFGGQLRQFLKETNISQYRRQLKQLTDKVNYRNIVH